MNSVVNLTAKSVGDFKRAYHQNVSRIFNWCSTGPSQLISKTHMAVFTLALLLGLQAQSQSKAQSTTTETLSIKAISEGLVIFNSQRPIKVGRHVMIYRHWQPQGKGLRNDNRIDSRTGEKKGAKPLDILARGQVEGTQKNRVFVKLDLASVRKVPKVGDFIVLLAPPLGGAGPDGDLEKPLVVDSLPKEPESGYIQWTRDSYFGGLGADNTTLANGFKRSDFYSFTGWSLTWFFQFLWRVGVSYQEWDGVFPTATYFRNTGDSTIEGRQIRFYFKTRKFYKNIFRTTFFLTSFNETFDTFNPDEALLSSQAQGVGGGLRLSGEFTPVTWKAKGKYLGVALHEVFATFQYLNLDVKDTGVIKRGDAGGGSALEWRTGLSAFLYLPWIPYVKRFVFSAFYGQRFHNIQFSGPTLSEVGGIYEVPTGGSYEESYNFYTFQVGVRLDDFIGRFLLPR